MIKKYFSLYVTGIILIVVLALGGGLHLWRTSTESTNMAISETKLSEIKDMLKLCTMEVCDDVAIKDSINGKWIFAKATVNGYIRFDLEKLDYQVKNDSVVIILPPEEIEIYESSANNSYEVIDTWNASMLDLRRMTAAEETAIKKRMARKYKASFYDKGYVKRARASAVETLSRLLSIIDPKIMVIDPQDK